MPRWRSASAVAGPIAAHSARIRADLERLVFQIIEQRVDAVDAGLKTVGRIRQFRQTLAQRVLVLDRTAIVGIRITPPQDRQAFTEFPRLLLARVTPIFTPKSGWRWRQFGRSAGGRLADDDDARRFQIARRRRVRR